MTKIYSCNKQGSINDNWFPLWSSDENGYVTKLMFCEHIKELDDGPGFIVSVYDRLSMKVIKMTCMSEEDMLRVAVIPVRQNTDSPYAATATK